ncbi:MAG: N-acetylglucosamine-6-phosphate deacetylase [Sneathiellales bacterium]|nr:N-acetylglucosamine-6-phosphate deacetylase [Sneathiellales bacterium]
MTFLTAHKILIDHELKEDCFIEILETGFIGGIFNCDTLSPNALIQDLGDVILTPGLFDLQVNGGGGILLNDKPDLEGIKTVLQAHQKTGTTSLLPTLITDSFDIMQQMADAVEEAHVKGLTGIRGIHFEGPYLNAEKKGVHSASLIRGFEEKFLDLVKSRNLETILVTLAPECVSSDYLAELVKAGVIVSAGHSNASYEQTAFALKKGVSAFTHLFNAMPPFLSREPGIVGAALEDRESYCSFIADGHHIHPATLSVALAAKGTGKSILVSDAMPCVSNNEQDFQLYGESISVKNGRCINKAGTLAGSAIALSDAVHFCVENGLADLDTAIGMASGNPAKLMKLDGLIGSIRPGLQAEFSICSADGKFQEALTTF